MVNVFWKQHAIWNNIFNNGLIFQFLEYADVFLKKCSNIYFFLFIQHREYRDSIQKIHSKEITVKTKLNSKERKMKLNFHYKKIILFAFLSF